MTRRHATIAVSILIVLGLAARIGVILYTGSYRANPGAAEHASIAASLLEGNGFAFNDFGYYGPSSVQSPPYPLLTAAAFYLLGVGTPAAYLALMVFNALVGALVIWLTYLLARTIGASPSVAMLAAAACAVWPSQVYASNFAQGVTLIIAGMTAIILLYYRAMRSGSAGYWIAFSLVGTVSALTEPVLLPIVALSGLLVLVWPAPPVMTRARRLGNAAILLAAALLVIGPWTIRNRLVHHAWVPIKSTFWVNVWKGANDYATGTDRLAMSSQQQQSLWSGFLRLDDQRMRQSGADDLRQYSMLTDEQRAELWGKPEMQREQVFKRWATAWIAQHPARYAQLSLVRLFKTLWIEWDNPKSHQFFYVLSRAIIVPLSLIGLVLAWRRRWLLAYPLLVIGSCLLTYALTLTAARFSMPFEPFQFCLAALTLTVAADALGARTTARHDDAIGNDLGTAQPRKEPAT